MCELTDRDKAMMRALILMGLMIGLTAGTANAQVSADLGQRSVVVRRFAMMRTC